MAILFRGLRLGRLGLTDGEVGGIRGDGDVRVVWGGTGLQVRLEDVAVVYLHVGEGGLDVPVDSATHYERHCIEKRQERPYPHEDVVEKAIEEGYVDDAYDVIEDEREDYGDEPAATTLVLSDVIIVDVLTEDGCLLRYKPQYAESLDDEGDVEHVAGEDGWRGLEEGIIYAWRESESVEGYIHKDMRQPYTYHRHYERYDGAYGEALTVEQIDAGGKVKADGKEEEKWTREVIEREIVLLVKDSEYGEKADEALKE